MPLITCPNCQHQFEPTDIMREEIKREANLKAAQWKKEKEEEFRQKELSFNQALQLQKETAEKQLLQQQQHLEAERKKLALEMEAQIRRQLAGDFENKLGMLERMNTENEAKLKAARQKELEYLEQQQRLIDKENQIDLEIQRKLLEARINIEQQIRQQEVDKYSLKDTEYQMQLRELQKQLEDQKKMAEEMRRKAEQGSMQLQGEVQELALEELLRSAFPYDTIREVGKGVKGADCMQVVRNKFGQECGCIIYESKRTHAFSADWIDKLKADMRSQGADLAILVTQRMPKDMERFGEKDGVWICSFAEVKALAYVLREGIIKMSGALKSQDNKGDKMQLLYNYLTSNEFNEQWNAIREGFLSMRNSIQRERDSMEKMWKAREKQLEKVLLNVAHFKGSIEGIAGQEFNLNLLEDSYDTDG
ncbi:MAG: DUF2130 domain-containing protein [Bacteroidota bacterium]